MRPIHGAGHCCEDNGLVRSTMRSAEIIPQWNHTVRLSRVSLCGEDNVGKVRDFEME